jgi:hypothetical protein
MGKIFNCIAAAILAFGCSAKPAAKANPAPKKTLDSEIEDITKENNVLIIDDVPYYFHKTRLGYTMSREHNGRINNWAIICNNITPEKETEVKLNDGRMYLVYFDKELDDYALRFYEF